MSAVAVDVVEAVRWSRRCRGGVEAVVEAVVRPVRVLGLMSGTSVDGVDAAAAEISVSGDELRVVRLGEATLPWPARLRERVLAALPPATTTAAEICRLDHDLGVAFGDLAARMIDRLGRRRVDLIASHGQTVHHEVDGAGQVRGTLQLGQAAQIAERTGLPVVADLRARDVAAGGQGAPLVSVLDTMLLNGVAGVPAPGASAGPASGASAGPASGASAGPASGCVAALNLGGIANFTVLRGDQLPVAFDCGPANALIDLAVARATGEPYDAGGARTRRGTVDRALLATLLEDPYLAAPPPKSTGRERYHAGYLDAALARAPVPRLDDLLATLAEYSSAAVAADAARYGVGRLWASGGGVRNAGLMAALRRRLAAAGARLATTDELGLPVDHKEAYAFAVLGWLTWHGLAGTVPSCTGAAGPRVLGAVVPGAGPLRLPPPLASPPRRAVVQPELPMERSLS